MGFSVVIRHVLRASLFAVRWLMALLWRTRPKQLEPLFTTADFQARYFQMTNLLPQAAVPSHTEVKQSYRSAARSARGFLLPATRALCSTPSASEGKRAGQHLLSTRAQRIPPYAA